MYGDVVLGIDHYNFEELLDLKKDEAGVMLDTYHMNIEDASFARSIF